MRNPLLIIKQKANIIQSRIAFYPTLMAIAGFVFAFLMIYFEEQGISKYLLDSFPQLVMEDGDTALSVLNVCIGGLISMMVFSFSMVMLLLSQASSNFSPRLLPGLISDRRNQMVLGFFLGTIVYNIFTLFNIESTGEKYTLPGFSVLLGIVFTITCFGAFIFFIHSISQSIQINNILDSIYSKAEQRLKQELEKDQGKHRQGKDTFPATEHWTEYKAGRNGYLQNISTEALLEAVQSLDTKVYLTVAKGMYVMEDLPLIRSERPLDKEEIASIMAGLNFDRSELIEDNYILAFKQITEIIVKAMSPGINDPGTAINGIDYLTSLFATRLRVKDSGIIFSEGKSKLKLAIIHFDELLYNVMASLRTYCKHDPIIVQKLIWMLTYLSAIDHEDSTYNKSLEQELDLLLESTAFEAPKDRKILNQASKALSGLTN